MRGVTPEIFYGTYVPAQGEPRPGEPRLIRRSGLVDCLTVYGTTVQVDANTADPAVLASVGMPYSGHRRPGAGAQGHAVESRAAGADGREFGPAADLGAPGGQLHLTIRATARVRTGQRAAFGHKRTVSAHGEVHAVRLSIADSHPALVRHHVEQLTWNN